MAGSGDDTFDYSFRRLSFASKFMAKSHLEFVDKAAEDELPAYNIPTWPVNAVMYLDGPQIPDKDSLNALVDATIPKFDRLNALLIAGPKFVPCSTWRPSLNVTWVSVNSDESMMRVENEMMMSPLDMRKPLWHMHVVEDLRTAATISHNEASMVGKSRIFFRFHHALGDGLSLMAVFKSIATVDEAGCFNLNSPEALEAEVSAKKAKNTTNVSSEETPTLLAPKKKVVTPSTCGAFGKVICMPVGPSDTDTIFKVEDVGNPKKTTRPSAALSPGYIQSRKLCFFSPMSLEMIKTVKTKHNCTVNDVATACLCASFRKYMELRKDPNINDRAGGKGPLFRVLIPYFLPRTQAVSKKDDDNEIIALHNNWCFLSLALPLQLADPIERLEYINAEMTKLKRSPEAYLQLKVNEVGSALLPFSVASQTAKDIMSKHSCVFTNIPGPQFPTYVSGSQMSGLSVFLNNNIPQVSLISYNNQVRTTMVADAELFPQMEKIGDFMMDALLELL